MRTLASYKMIVPRSSWSVNAGLLICPAATALLSLTKVYMPHSAAMPYCIRKPLCLPGPQPLCPLVLYPTCLTVGPRHAPITQAMCPPVGLMRLGRPRQQVRLSSDQGSDFYPPVYLRLDTKGLAGDMHVGLNRLFFWLRHIDFFRQELNRNCWCIVKSVTVPS